MQSSFQEDVLTNIQKILREKGISQAELSRLTEIDPATISKTFSGAAQLKVNTLSKIATSLKMSVVDIITYPDRYVRISSSEQEPVEAILQIKLKKDRKDGTVTLPDVVVKLMIELEIFSHPDSYYLFSHQLLPGPERHSSKQFTDYWSHYIRKDLRFPDKWKFYSLKDTGITDLIREHTDLLSVRNQARHHSLLMTDIYTPHDIEEANDVIKSRKAAF